jgi:hypothetical protein
MKPTIIDDNFLNQNELEDIKAKVFMLKDHWKGINIRNENNDSLISRVLPAGAYSKYFSKLEIESNNKLMLEHFSYYYDKIKNKLSLHFNVPIRYSNNLQLPGFHIFLNNNGNNKVVKSDVNFHLDKFPMLGQIVNLGKIKSVIIPITVPHSGAHLLFNSSGDRTMKNRLLPNVSSDEIFNYNPGIMATWSGDLQHSIGPYTLLDSSDSRITMQMHVSLYSDHGLIFW